MNGDETKTVTISREEYDMLCACHLYYSILTDAIFKDASLSWDKKSLNLGSSTLDDLMELIAKKRYWRVYMKLQEGKNEGIDQAGE